MKAKEAVGDTIRSLRLEQNKTLRQVSAKSFVALGYLSEVERGHKYPSVDILESLSEALGVTLPDLYRMIADRLESYPFAR